MERKAIVLGTELAAAREAEQMRLGSTGNDPSPLSGRAYDLERHEFDLTAVAPVQLDVEIQALLKAWRGAGAGERDVARRSLSLEDNYTLIQFAKRMAVVALNQPSPAACEHGLMALAMIDECRIDSRDALWAAGLLNHAAGAWPDQAVALLQGAIAMATPAMGAVLAQAADSALEDWGYRERRTSEGIGLIRCGWDPYNPTVDLAAVAMRVGARVLAARYVVEIEVATKLPSVWFDRARRRHADETLARSLGIAASHGTLRRAFRDRGNQMFVIWIAEMPSPHDCVQLVSDVGAGTGHEGRFAVGVSGGCLFALLVAGSCQEGVQPFESLSTIVDLAEQTRAELSMADANSGGVCATA
jgi:hypothetical protein